MSEVRDLIAVSIISCFATVILTAVVVIGTMHDNWFEACVTKEQMSLNGHRFECHLIRED